jgi:hypothetical protein
MCLAIQAAELSAWMRIVLCFALVASNLHAGAVFLGFSGKHAVRALEWGGEALRISIGDRAPVPAARARGSFRCGRAFLVLWLRAATSRRLHAVIVPAGTQDPALFRGLCRWLAAGFPRQGQMTPTDPKGRPGGSS